MWKTKPPYFEGPGKLAADRPDCGIMATRCNCLIVVIAVAVTSASLLAGEAENHSASQAAEDLRHPALRVMQTPAGTHFGLFGEKPPRPAPTIFILANSIDHAGADPTRLHTTAGRELAKDGWIYVVLDPALEGYSRIADEPSGIAGWAHRVKTGQDFLGRQLKDCIDVLNHLIAEGYTDPERIAVSGTSRGGFFALHLAAAEPRVRAVTAVSPVTNPLALSEFAGVTEEQVKSIQLDRVLDRLAGKAVWLSIGNDDRRVSTDDCIELSRKLVSATQKRRPDLNVVPVELIVGPSLGHGAIDNVYLLEAEFLRKQFR